MTRILVLGAGGRGLAALLQDRCVAEGIKVLNSHSIAEAVPPMLLSRDIQPPPPVMAREPRQEAQWKSERRGRS